MLHLFVRSIAPGRCNGKALCSSRSGDRRGDIERV